MKKVLMVAYFFPPIATVGSLRPLGFCRYIGRYGWLPAVLTTEPSSVYPPLMLDENLCRRLPDLLKVHRTPDTNPLQLLIHTRNDLRKRVRSLLGFPNQPLPLNPEGPETAKAGLHKQISALKNSALDWLFSFPDPQCAWLRPAIHRISRLPLSDRPDVVFATGGPWTGLLVGKAIARRFRVPFIADLRDPWIPWISDPVGDNNDSGFLFRQSRQLEKSVYAAASQVITATEEHRAKLVSDHPELEGRCVTITNGFDSEAWNSVGRFDENGKCRPSSRNKNVLELCHFGSVYGERDPLRLLQAVKEFIHEGWVKSGQLRIRFTGTWDVSDHSCEALARELEVNGFLTREAPVPYEVCLRQMATAQMLLVLPPGHPLCIPAKIYDYIAAGRPFLMIGGEGAAARLVERHRLGRRCPNETSEIKELLGQLLTGRIQLETPRPEDRAAFDYPVLAGKLASVLDQACAMEAARPLG